VEVEQQEVASLAGQDNQSMVNALEVGDLPEIQGVFVPTIRIGGIPEGSVIAQDPYLQYLEGLTDGEDPKQIYVAHGSVPLQIMFPYVNSQGPVESVLDTGSQIVLMSLEKAQFCGLVQDPNINIFIQSAKGKFNQNRRAINKGSPARIFV
jgi:hypothetical protein